MNNNARQGGAMNNNARQGGAIDNNARDVSRYGSGKR